MTAPGPDPDAIIATLRQERDTARTQAATAQQLLADVVASHEQLWAQATSLADAVVDPGGGHQPDQAERVAVPLARLRDRLARTPRGRPILPGEGGRPVRLAKPTGDGGADG
jgi:Mg-chelatase subunit ChlI